VLRMAAVADAQRTRAGTTGVIRQRVRVARTDRRNPVRHSMEVESWGAGKRAFWRGDSENLYQRYQARGLGDALPLSAVAWERWLEGTGQPIEVKRGSDVVELQSNSTGRVQDLESVSLRIRREDWHVKTMQLTFTDSVFEISEMDFTVL